MVDKLYIMLPEFEEKRLHVNAKALERLVDDLDKKYGNNGRIRRYLTSKYAKGMNPFEIVAHMIERGVTFESGSVEEALYYDSKKNPDVYQERRFVKVQYDFAKSPKENSKEARNNMLIDLMYGVLTSADTASKILNPGNFDPQKKATRIVSILQSGSARDIASKLGKPGIKGKDLIKILEEMSLSELNALAKETKEFIDPLSPYTQVYFHHQNMTGGKLIGIYANHNANHALMQHTQLSLNPEVIQITINGKTLYSLHDVTNQEGEYISKNNAGYLAASVDNVKDPVLAGMNQNTFTADASMLLSRLGYTPLEIGLFMNQPIIREITTKFFRESKKGKYADDIIQEVVDSYSKGDAKSSDATTLEKMAYNLTTGEKGSQFIADQYSIGLMFQTVMTAAKSLGKLVQATRSDTQGGAAGPTIADTAIKIQRVEDFIEEEVKPETTVLLGAEVIDPYISANTDTETLRQQLLNSPLPYLQAFYTLGIKSTSSIIAQYFPQFNDNFIEVIDTLRSFNRNNRLDANTMNSIYNDLFVYMMSGIPFFGSEGSYSSREKRKAFINSFPKYFREITTKYKDVLESNLLASKKLQIQAPTNNNPIETVVFKNVGRLSSTAKDSLSRDWEALLYSENSELRDFAINLFRYSYYRNGFSFGPNSFIHLAPLSLRQAIPGYLETLRYMMNYKVSFGAFVNQYVLNHLDNRKLVSVISGNEAVTRLVAPQGKAQNEFTITGNSVVRDTTGLHSLLKNISLSGKVSLVDVFATEVGGETVYYLRDRSTDGDIQTYTKVTPLGVRNGFLEYEFGAQGELMQSVIDQSKVTGEPQSLQPTITSEDSMLGTPKSNAEVNWELVADTALQISGQEPISNSNQEEDKANFDSFFYQEHKDADGQEICK